MGSLSPGFAPAGTITLMFRPTHTDTGVQRHRSERTPHSRLLTIFALRDRLYAVLVRVSDPEERRDRVRQAGRYGGWRDVLLYTLVAERRRVDDAVEARDGLWEPQPPPSDPAQTSARVVVGCMVLYQGRKGHARRLSEGDAEELRDDTVAGPDDGRVVELDGGEFRGDTDQSGRTG